MWLEVVFSLLLGILAFYFYTSRNNNYWKERGVPFDPPKPFLGSFLFSILFQKVELHKHELNNYKKYGRLYGYFEGSKPALIVAIPDLIRDITIKDFNIFYGGRNPLFFDGTTNYMLPFIKGERWKKLRTLTTPIFSSGKMRKMCYLINECIETTCCNLEGMASKKTPVNLKKMYGAFTMDVIATTAFGTKINSHHDPDNPFVKHAQKTFTQAISLSLILLITFPFLKRFLKIGFTPPETNAFFKKIAEDLIQKRKNQEEKRYDFLQLLLDASEDDLRVEGSDQGEFNSDTSATGVTSTKGLSIPEIIAQCILFFSAGYETTASTLAFASYNLALNPECQDKLAAEVKQVLEQNDDVLDYDTVKKMVYLDAVMSETLRLFPPLLRIERMAHEDYVLGNTGLTLSKGTVVGIPIYGIHHDPDFFPNPEEFHPDRFLPENRSSLEPFAYIPFGSGPKGCVAERFARMEIKLCLARVISRFKLRTAPETQIPPKVIPSMGFLTTPDITLLVERRA